MKKLIFTTLCLALLISYSVSGSHIMGGTLGVFHKQDNAYTIKLKLIFDNLHSDPALLEFEKNVTAAIYSKNDNKLIDVILLNLISQNFLISKNKCSDLISVRVLEYQIDVSLSPSFYNSPDGYYVVWERCCRTYAIDNIINPGNTGMAFYAEFPATNEHINSSPEFDLNYPGIICADTSFSHNITASDKDGDSLSFSLVKPFKGHTSEAVPLMDIPHPAPYPFVDYKSGYSLENPLNAKTNISISSSGLLETTPQTQGNFIFTIKCEEYRYQKKIAEVYFDYQTIVNTCNELCILDSLVDDQPESTYFAAYANLVEDEIHIKFGDEPEAIYQFNIYDYSGNKVYQYQSLAHHEVSIPVASLNNGVYFLEIITPQTTKRSRFIKR